MLLSFPLRFLLLASCWLTVQVTSPAVAQEEEEKPAQGQHEFFLTKVVPVVVENCLECHSHAAGEGAGGLMMDSLAAMLSGGSRGAAIVPQHPEQSLLIKALSYEDAELQMPPEGRLSDEEIDALKRWIAEGANVPPHLRGQPTTPAAVSATSPSIDPKLLKHWAYLPPNPWRPAKSTIGRAGQSQLDGILLEQLTANKLSFSARADRRTLIRRLSYDLRGLPPSLEMVERFISDERPDEVAFAELVDRMLASPQFGERWARYWMDVARYADNKGYVFREDREYAEAYKYRDWLIRAFNDDMPYDDFLTQQLAADLIATDDDQTNLPALGYLTLGRRFLNNKLDIIDDRLDVVARGMMGMTLSCARCHDHKYDPISQADYYSLVGVFLNTTEPGGDPWPHRLQDAEKNRDAHILIRGSVSNIGAKVPRKFVSFLAPDAKPFSPKGSGRMELAEHIASDQNPLTARVMANRVWMRLMGDSLVESPSDLGTRCPPPKQQHLLDQLAIELIRNDWSVKSLIRQIVLSDSYAQQSLDRKDAAKIDPTNSLYWRMNRRRLDFESFRDTLLSSTGQLDEMVFGKSQTIHDEPFTHRRTLYAYIDRQNLPSMFRTFDMASPDTHSPRRPQTSVPQQGLFLLNSEFVAHCSSSLATRLAQVEQELGREVAIRELFANVLSRRPSPTELTMFQEYLEAATDSASSMPPEYWICGYGAFDPTAEKLSGFQRLPRFTDKKWQGGSKLPDSKLGWCMLNAAGGHVGNDLQHAVVRRWIAPRDGRIHIGGQLSHSSDQGDGVRGSILVDGKCVERWQVKNSKTATPVRKVAIQAGQTVDFVADCLGTPNHDSFAWRVTLNYPQGSQFDSYTQFPGPRKQPYGVWAEVVHALLATNELAFVD